METELRILRVPSDVEVGDLITDGENDWEKYEVIWVGEIYGSELGCDFREALLKASGKGEPMLGLYEQE
jgi:hypothetical protein